MILTYQIYAYLTKVFSIVKDEKRSPLTKEINVDKERITCPHGEHLGRECYQCKRAASLEAHAERIAKVPQAVQTDKKGPAAKLRKMKQEAKEARRNKPRKPAPTRMLPPPEVKPFVSDKPTGRDKPTTPVPRPVDAPKTKEKDKKRTKSFSRVLNPPKKTSDSAGPIMGNCSVPDCPEMMQADSEGLCRDCRIYMLNWRMHDEDASKMDLIPTVRPIQVAFFRRHFSKHSRRAP